MKEKRLARRKRLFGGYSLADLKGMQSAYWGRELPKGMKAEELEAEIARREAIAKNTTVQPRRGGRFVKVPKTITELLKDNELENLKAANKQCLRPKPTNERHVVDLEVPIPISDPPLTALVRKVLREELQQVTPRRSEVLEALRGVVREELDRGGYQNYISDAVKAMDQAVKAMNEQLQLLTEFLKLQRKPTTLWHRIFG